MEHLFTSKLLPWLLQGYKGNLLISRTLYSDLGAVHRHPQSDMEPDITMSSFKPSMKNVVELLNFVSA